jgi:hypothetical protein
MTAIRTIAISVVLLGGSIWIGSMVCLAVVARVATRVLSTKDRVALFAEVGRIYRVLGTASLIAAICVAAVLAGEPGGWNALTVAAFVLAVLLVGLSLAGMRQARRMTAMRRAMAPGSPPLVHAGRDATVLRSLMGVVTLAIVIAAAGVLAG